MKTQRVETEKPWVSWSENGSPRHAEIAGLDKTDRIVAWDPVLGEFIVVPLRPLTVTDFGFELIAALANDYILTNKQEPAAVMAWIIEFWRLRMECWFP